MVLRPWMYLLIALAYTVLGFIGYVRGFWQAIALAVIAVAANLWMWQGAHKFYKQN